MAKPVKKTCKNGHTFMKSSDCPVCPICEAERLKNSKSDLPKIGAPATRALERIGVRSLKDAKSHSEAELNALHGFGPKAMGILKAALESQGMTLKG